jgi:hypothetical protein
MKVGDLVYARHPRIVGSDKPGIIIQKKPMYKVGYRYQVLFPVIGTRWIKWAHSLIKFEEALRVKE